jgi:RNA polymerase sigma factor (sigma-70 family)
LFDFQSDRQSAQNTSVRTVALRQAKQSVEIRQRDIYDSHRHRTFALAYYMTGNELEAEQILTSTFVRAFCAGGEPNAHQVDSALLEELRERGCLRPDPDAPADDASSISPEPAASLADHNVKRTDLEEAMRSLPAADRLLFLLRDVEGYSSAAIAQLLEMPEPQVQRGLMTARLRLRRILAGAQTGNEEKAA